MARVWQLLLPYRCHTAATALGSFWVPMTYAIWKVKARDSLAARREPYWGPPLGEGKSLGFRKIDASRGRWIAKLRNHTGHHSRVLGDLTEDFDYDQARDAALRWFKLFDPASPMTATRLKRHARITLKIVASSAAKLAPTTPR